MPCLNRERIMKYDWITLEREFTAHKRYRAVSLREFARLKGIPYGRNFRAHTEGWLEKRAAKEEQKGRRIEAELSAAQISEEVRLNRRHLELYGVALDAIERSLREELCAVTDMFGRTVRGEIQNHAKLKSLLQSLEIAQRGQRLALGLDRPDREKGGERECSRYEEALTRLWEERKRDES